MSLFAYVMPSTNSRSVLVLHCHTGFHTLGIFGQRLVDVPTLYDNTSDALPVKKIMLTSVVVSHKWMPYLVTLISSSMRG